MSYCRFSSDDFQCDVYVYAGVMGGWTPFVAGGRYVSKEPLPPKVPFDSANMDAWMARDQKVSDMIDGCETVPIGLPHDGESFNHGTAGECADLLESLRAVGYNVPQSAIDALREEDAYLRRPADVEADRNG